MLTSLQNEQVKYVVNLHKRKFREETGEFLIEGWRFVEEGVRRGADITKVFVCPERCNEVWPHLEQVLKENEVPVIEVEERVLRKMSDTENPQGILAIVKQTMWSWNDFERAQASQNLQDSQDPQGLPILLILDGVQDPGNCGTILRTALAAGVTQVCLTEGTVDLYNLKALRSTMGTIFSMKILTHCQPEAILSFCQEHKITVYTGDIQGKDIYETELSMPLALVVGNEGNGPSEAFRGSGVNRITIPMSHGVESLNVAMATGIILYEVRRKGGKRPQ
ncbi:rRNA methylase [Desulfitobacterium dichloroeliminans LMG P-21439]|uniref:rRNA methylase n=1 Tax=Desulfitobacterium dichloroeliminans (strain LMG P-21439 / DCA1) TaxID=871963 RepID=L0F4Z1_DESDL|nr:RNA methyltransferase [Desulfitobacterium dichloroeliminans]AGA67736.1 rRNA methylase [Desulfitobacterium dichloroeliminans LMG P-21439]